MSGEYKWQRIDSGVADDLQGAKREAEEVAKLAQELYGLPDEKVRIEYSLHGDDFGKNPWHVYICE